MDACSTAHVDVGLYDWLAEMLPTQISACACPHVNEEALLIIYNPHMGGVIKILHECHGVLSLIASCS